MLSQPFLGRRVQGAQASTLPAVACSGGGDHLRALVLDRLELSGSGRPNCSRILAYAEAVSVAQRAMPTASAESRVVTMARPADWDRFDSSRSLPISMPLART